MHSSRMCTICCSDCFSYHGHPPRYAYCPTMHAPHHTQPLPCISPQPCTRPLPYMTPAMYVPQNTCPLPCMPTLPCTPSAMYAPCHACLPPPWERQTPVKIPQLLLPTVKTQGGIEEFPEQYDQPSSCDPKLVRGIHVFTVIHPKSCENTK